MSDGERAVAIVGLGAILPDLLDKPIGSLAFAGYFGTGRIYGHTLLFAALVLSGVLVLTQRGTPARTQWMALPIGTFLHLILDVPPHSVTLFWPVLGFTFPPGPYESLSTLLAHLGDHPLVVAQEAVGLTYLIVLWRKSRLWETDNRRLLVRTGRLPV